MGWQKFQQFWHQGIQSTRQKLLPFRVWLVWFCIGVSLTATIAACSGNNASSSNKSNSDQAIAQNPQVVELNLVSFAVTKRAHDAIIPKFVEFWKKEHNQTVSFKQASYGGSGTQAQRVIEGGLEADVVHLALGLDIDKLVKAGLVNSDWEQRTPNGGIASKSVVALAVRSGNPKGIKGFADLAKDGVSLVTANPKTSGVARWNFLALWNSVIHTGGDEAKAREFTRQVYENVPELPADARLATEAFFQRNLGDALLNYENELILAQQEGTKVEYVIPDINVSIENPVTIVDKNVDKHGNREVAEGFVNFLFTPEAQTALAEVGFRPIDADVAKQKEFVEQYPDVKVFSVQDFGGWDAVQSKFFADGAVFDQIQTQIKR